MVGLQPGCQTLFKNKITPSGGLLLVIHYSFVNSGEIITTNYRNAPQIVAYVSDINQQRGTNSSS